jgi:hypothetical protein
MAQLGVEPHDKRGGVNLDVCGELANRAFADVRMEVF